MRGAFAVTTELQTTRLTLRPLQASDLGPGKLPAPYEDSPTDIWGQTAAQWRAHRNSIS